MLTELSASYYCIVNLVLYGSKHSDTAKNVSLATWKIVNLQILSKNYLSQNDTLDA